MESELVQQEGEPPKEKTEVEDYEERLPDGTVHHTHKVRKLSITKIKTTWRSGEGEEIVSEENKEVPVSEDVVETFEEPAKAQCEEEDLETELGDGTTVHRKLVTNRMVHHVKQHQESFDSEHSLQVEDSEYDEVVPGTESTFVKDSDSDSDEEYGTDDDKQEVCADMLAKTSLSSKDQNEHKKADDLSALGEDEEVETHRLMMKKEVHKKTMIGPDGKEQTTVMEDSQIQQENEPPEELRDSMQEIINQFMESDPQPAQLPAPTQSKEEDV